MIVIRETTTDDIENIYNHLNLNYVKKYCKNNEEEQRKNHERWYRFLLSSSDYAMFTVEDLRGTFLGNVKFELNKDLEGAEISLYLAECIRGRGYSTTIVNASIEELRFKYLNLKYIAAYILEENEKSILCFEKAGFYFKGQIEHGGIDYLLYIKELS
ncbi:MAG: GNAT family N-acetyltransferase [Cetobacterium sp.]|uniref:GNAT family N-acetyltransferase n=1 Tax=unclassified Cetobacterium TaxID=2630983 RepID=UPI000647E680|nr:MULTISPECIES: GNAT family N-acetyltransferase [unclassified Cetobacterium]